MQAPLLQARQAGWFDYAELYDAAVAAAAGSATFVEVGCFLGLSTLHLARRIADSGKDITLWCVDTWDNRQGLVRDHQEQSRKLAAIGIPPARLFSQFCINALHADLLDGLRIVRAESTQAARLFEPAALDFVFLDAGHAYADVLADVKAWRSRVRPGGILAGHDYDRGHPEVMQALGDAFGFLPDRSGPCWQVRL